MFKKLLIVVVAALTVAAAVFLIRERDSNQVVSVILEQSSIEGAQSEPDFDSGNGRVSVSATPAFIATASPDVETIVVHAEADNTSEEVAELANPTLNEGPLVLSVVGIPASESDWINVQLPIRPNGSTGWIQVDQVDLAFTDFRLVVDRGEHQLTVYEAGQVSKTFEIAVGTGDTKTPVGEFFITELLQTPDPDESAYGPYAFGLSGFSNDLEEFNGGNGVIGIHGTNDPDSIGSDVSHGCVRLHNEDIVELRNLLPLGTPVTVI